MMSEWIQRWRVWRARPRVVAGIYLGNRTPPCGWEPSRGGYASTVVVNEHNTPRIPKRWIKVTMPNR